MTDTVAAALIGVSGAVVVAIAGAITQVLVTRSVIRAERDKIAHQIRGESAARAREARDVHLRDAVSEMLAVAEPEMFSFERYFKLLPHIHRVQLSLDPESPMDLAIMGAVNELAFAAEAYQRIGHATRPTEEMKLRLLDRHSRVGEATRRLITRPLRVS